MLDSAPMIAFAATAEAGAAKHFYRDVLKLHLVADEPFALVFNAHGTMLRIQKVEAVVPMPYTALGWQVDDIEAVCGRLTEAGVELERFEGLPQDERGIMTFPDGAQVAWFRDPDGNLLSLTQEPG